MRLIISEALWVAIAELRRTLPQVRGAGLTISAQLVSVDYEKEEV